MEKGIRYTIYIYTQTKYLKNTWYRTTLSKEGGGEKLYCYKSTTLYRTFENRCFLCLSFIGHGHLQMYILQVLRLEGLPVEVMLLVSFQTFGFHRYVTSMFTNRTDFSWLSNFLRLLDSNWRIKYNLWSRKNCQRNSWKSFPCDYFNIFFLFRRKGVFQPFPFCWAQLYTDLRFYLKKVERQIENSLFSMRIFMKLLKSRNFKRLYWEK